MEILIERQFSLMSRISNGYTNFKKVAKANQTKGCAESRLETLDKNWEKFEKNHDELMTFDEIIQEAYTKNDTFSLVEESYLIAKGNFKDFINQCPENRTNAQQKGERSSSGDREDGKLRQLELPKFKGDFQEWPRFKELFNQMITSRKNMSNIYKLKYLIESLEGEPAELIKTVPISGDQFETAFQVLKENYENNRLLVNHLLSSLMDVQPVRAETSTEIRRILTATSNILQSLETLKRPINKTDDLVVYLTVTRLDTQSKKEWETHLANSENSESPPTFEDLKKFLKTRRTTLESLERSNAQVKKIEKTNHQTKNKVQANVAAASSTSKPRRLFINNSNKSIGSAGTKPRSCIACNKEHSLFDCDVFTSKSHDERKNIIGSKRLCYNCFGPHRIAQCPSKSRCQTCAGMHHTLLHTEKKVENPEDDMTQQQFTSNNASTVLLSAKPLGGVLLATAWISVESQSGRRIMARALIDQAAQSSFISKHLCDALGIIAQQINMTVSGIGSKSTGKCQELVTFSINPHFSRNLNLKVDALVLPTITNYTPSIGVPQKFAHIQGITLADPQYFDQKRPIDILLGAEVHADIVYGEIRRGHHNEPIATSTSLGWMLSGRTDLATQAEGSECLHTHTEDLSNLLQKFWEVEEFSHRKHILTPAEEACENFYKHTVARDEQGRYIVRLPFKNGVVPNKGNFGNTYKQALRVFQRMENKCKHSENFKKSYDEVFKEHLRMGHMKQVSMEDIDMQNSCFLTHHGIIKESSSTTKFRMVVNASLKSAITGNSFNDTLEVGENLIPDLIDLILEWRLFEYAFSADIEKMFRQILLHEEDQKFQLIVWRFRASDSILIFKLTYPCFGLVCSPWLACRTLRQLALEYQKKYPRAAKIIMDKKVYMDDVPSGAHSLKEAKELRDELIQLLKEGGFPLRKWMSNSKELLGDLPSEFLDPGVTRAFQDKESISILGMTWIPVKDEFCFNISPEPTVIPLTKRLVLSRIAKIFDPLGWLSPVIISAKIFMQSLWLLEGDWSDTLPPSYTETWNRWYNSIHKLALIRFPRWTGYKPGLEYQLHGFADASEKAYGAAIYLRIINGKESQTSLLFAKSKVAPIKTISIPRLELCAAEILAVIMQHCISVLKLGQVPCHAWSDSADVLYWLAAHPSRWKTFVANRCANIHNTIPKGLWRHVSSADNPADMLSRGLEVDEFIDNELWLKGPPWLNQYIDIYNQAVVVPDRVQVNEAETRRKVTAMVIVSNTDTWNLLYKYSDLNKLLRITSICLRFIAKCRKGKISFHLNNQSYIEKIITPEEIENALYVWCFLVQQNEFSREIKDLKKDGAKGVATKSSIAKLRPFLDSQGILRVGGRIKHSLLEEDSKHPIILPQFNHLTYLIVGHYHKKVLHGGVQITLATIRRQFWILKGRQMVKSVIHKCVPCIRYRGTTAYQLMGGLPAVRVRPASVFQNAGVDYAGPFKIRPSQGRGRASLKGYIAIFVCLATKAVHLEVVSDYSADAFIATFKRFTARRGHCATLYSDKGTNFVGADAELRSLFHNARSDTLKSIRQTLSDEGTIWKFNPPGAPHFGGIWEAAVKSTKHHLRRVVGDHSLTYEELSTLLCEIEACLNSRPLTALTDDPTDPQPLTPAHFLIGRPSFLIPQPRITEEKIPPLKRWKLLSQMTQDFWNRWSAEYLQTLQVRNKWTTIEKSPRVGDIVLIKHEDTLPAKWPLARVIKVHKGPDDTIRVVTLKTATSEIKRPIVKIIPLVSEENKTN